MIAARLLRDPARTLVLGTIAGFGFGAVGVAARVLNGFAPLTLLRDPAAYAVVAAGIVSFVFYATALEGGSVTVATSAVVLAETLPPAVIGVIFLGDTTRQRPHPGGRGRFRPGGRQRRAAGPVRRGRAAATGSPAATTSPARFPARRRLRPAEKAQRTGRKRAWPRRSPIAPSRR